jgi:hypothetical protein
MARRIERCRSKLAAAFLFLAGTCAAQQSQADMARIVERLDRLERENRQLTEQVRTLQARLDGVAETAAPVEDASRTPPSAPATLEQRITIEERRTADLTQTKVEASQKFPIRIVGMALFNAFLNSRQSGGVDYPTVAAATGPRRGGATVRQSVIGLEYRGPETAGGGRVSGSAYMDFFVGVNNPTFRIRTASIAVDWKTRGVLVGLEKPIFNPREPDSLAQVGISPMTGTGNLWLWLPQARVQQNVAFGRMSGVRAQLGVLQTREVAPFGGSGFSEPLETARPALEGRFEFYHRLDGERRLEIAPGFHKSTTHAAGQRIPSNIVSADWFFNPHTRLELSGAFYSGRNTAPLGNGYQQGFLMRGGAAIAVRSIGGWGQLTVRAAPRVDLHLFTGEQDDDDRDLIVGRIGRNRQFGANLFYRLAPNVLLGLESSQVRTSYIGQSLRINNHYDVALAYYF